VLDLERFMDEPASRGPATADLAAFAPDLVVNADPDRHHALDLLAKACQPVAAVAFPTLRLSLGRGVQAWLDRAYQWILPDSSLETLLAALGLGPETRVDPETLIQPPPPPTVDRQAFLLEPDWSASAWIEILLSYLDAFKPGEPVALIFFLGRDSGGVTVDQAVAKVRDIAVRSGRQAFPEVFVLDRLEELAEVLTAYPVHCRLSPERGSVEGLVGPFGTRLARSRLRMAETPA
jgi:hypothetical protein